MPSYNDYIDRTEAGPLMPEQVQRAIVQGVVEQSAFLQLATRLPNMSRKQMRMPVLSSLPTAYFVEGDTGLKQTSQVSWANKYITAEELAVIVPVPDSVAADADYDIWGEIQPRIQEAMGKAIDRAVFFGVNAPAAWPTNLKSAAIAAGNSVTLGTGADLYDDILGENGLISKVEADGFMVNGHVCAMTMKARYRGLRDADGGSIFLRSMQERTRYELDGEPMLFPRNGSMDPLQALQFSGDWSQLVYSIRQDITAEIFREGVIQDGTGQIVHNLMQQDMRALRVVFRIGWQVPNPINALQPTEDNRFPIGVLVP